MSTILYASTLYLSLPSSIILMLLACFPCFKLCVTSRMNVFESISPFCNLDQYCSTSKSFSTVIFLFFGIVYCDPSRSRSKSKVTWYFSSVSEKIIMWIVTVKFELKNLQLSNLAQKKLVYTALCSVYVVGLKVFECKLVIFLASRI